MVSRDTSVHLVAVLIAVVVLAVGATLVDDNGTALAVALVAQGIALGGAHAYLTWRNDDGLVPVGARRRFVIVVALFVGIAGLGALGPDTRLAGLASDAIVAAIAGALVVVYLVFEARAGYLASRTESTTD